MADIDETRVESFAADIAEVFYDIAYRAAQIGWNAGHDKAQQAADKNCMDCFFDLAKEEHAESKKQPKTPAGEYRHDGENGWVKKPAEDQIYGNICEDECFDEKPLGKGLDEW